MLKKHKSTVTSLAWCVNNKFVVTGSTDMKCRIFSAYLDGIDSPEDDGFGEVFPKQHEFGEVLAEFDQGRSWVNSVAWAPGGFRLAFASQGSILNFIQLIAGSQPFVQSINCRDLPYLDIQFLSDNTLVGAGFEANIDLFTVSGGTDIQPLWTFKEKVDKKQSTSAAPSSGIASKIGVFASAQNKFASADTQGVAFGSSAASTAVTTKHKNSILNFQLFPTGDGSLIAKFSTGGLDGRVCFWDVSSFGLK
jgi:actin related protein 2/3 complex subunit 1A/1B